MIRCKRWLAPVGFAFLLLFSGCTDISARTLDGYVPQEQDNGSPSGIGGDLLIITTEGEDTAPVTESSAIEEIYPTYTFSEQDEEFISSCVFMGDSTCLALSLYGFVTTDRCFAKGGVAARNIFDFTFTLEGDELEPLTALVNSAADNVVFMLGINDVNMTTSPDFVANYLDLIEKTRQALPYSDVYIMSITPVTEDSTFCQNSVIDEYNQAIREMAEGDTSGAVHFVDAAPLLKNSANALNSRYSGAEDGVHLSAAAYYAVLSALCDAQPE